MHSLVPESGFNAQLCYLVSSLRTSETRGNTYLCTLLSKTDTCNSNSYWARLKKKKQATTKFRSFLNLLQIHSKD